MAVRDECLRPNRIVWSADHIRQQSEKSRALDRAGKLSLLLGRNRRDPARHDFTALGYVTLQQPNVLVVDLWGVRAGEGTGLTTAKERPAVLRRCKRHGSSLLDRRRSLTHALTGWAHL